MGRKKKRSKGQKRHGSQKRKTAGMLEWVGGRLLAPAYITGGEQPYRPEIVLWLELPNDLIVASEFIDPEGLPVSFGATLLDAMASPLVGPPRRPGRVRVADARLAAEVRETIPDIEVVVAPTPELDRVIQFMLESLPPEPDSSLSYFEGGPISTEIIELLFRSARSLYRVSPWKKAHETQVIRLDIPAMGVEGACVSIIGGMGENFGLVIFPSFQAYERFLDVADPVPASGGPIDLGTPTLSLSFERGAELPSSMRREVAEHGWPVAGPKAFPLVQHRDREGLLIPLTEKDVRIVSACAAALSAFFARHARIFERETFDPVCESYFDEDGLEVRFTAPYHARHLFSPTDPLSERESKAKDPGPEKGPVEPSALHEMDQRLVERMMDFASRRFGDAWLKVADDFDQPDTTAQLLVPWSVYHFLVRGKPVSQWFAEEQGDRLSRAEIEWLEAQGASWLSLWEVTGVEFGRHLAARDLLTNEERVVQEIMGSKTIVRRDVFLGRIVDYHGVSVLCGVHTRPLPPMEADQVLQRVRGRLRRKSAVPPDRLRDEKIGRYMIACWEEAVQRLERRRSIPPELRNTDGDKLLFTMDHFDFVPTRRKDIETRLAALEDVLAPALDDPDQSYLFIRPGSAVTRALENTIVGKARVLDGRLRLEANSVKRADLLRERIEAACGDLIHHRIREHSDPLASLRAHENRPDANSEFSEIPPVEAGRIAREFKEKHYAEWADSPLPGLGGKTPREMIQTKDGKGLVDLLLRELENHEARLPKDEQFDFSGIRRDLGLEE
ncbi:MAG: hypothetical protein JRJ03_03300 [Deltaproteobacteria bacterium]|nr:hypothetical protein [Deltaproteobacteria bacterium]